MNKIAIFKTGKQTSMQGDTLDVTPDMLREVVATYNASNHEAPAVIGHPKINAPAYGWVSALSFSDDDGVLYADFSQVEPQFSQLLKDGRFKKRSASFYAPDSHGNPTKGKWHLRHVGFLGAQPPAVKGLKDFAEDANCPTYEFSDLSINQLDEEPMSEKDKKPDAAVAKAEASPSVDFAEREAKIAADEKALVAREAKLKANEAALAKKQEAERKKHFADFADTLIGCGKVLPAEKDAIVSAFIDIENSDKSFDFAEGSEVKSKSGVDVLKAILERAMPIIDFSERTGTDPNKAGAPSHGEGDSDEKLLKEIQDYADKHNVSFEVAIDLLSAEV